MSLPVAGTLREALFNLQMRRARLIRALALPCVLIAAIWVLMWIVIAGARFETLRYLPVLSFLLIPLWCLLAVSCHRVLLDDPDQPTVGDGVWLGLRQLHYLFLALVVGIPLVVYGAALPLLVFPRFDLTNPGIFAGYAREALELCLLIPLQYISSRFSLVLPAAALQEPMSLGQAWSETKGNGWRLTAILLAAPVTLSLLYPLFGRLFSESTVLNSTYNTVTNILAGIFSIAVLSYSYRWFMSHGPGISNE